jgi:hypothetical protein
MEWKQIRFWFTSRCTIEIEMPDALRCQLLPYDAVEALREWWEWLSTRYAVLVSVEVRRVDAVLRIRYDFSDDYDKCVKACTKEGKPIEECSPRCIEQAGEHAEQIFEEIRKKLDEAFSKHHVFYRTEEGWEYSVRYLHVFIPL